MTHLHAPYLQRLRDEVESIKADIAFESQGHGPPPHSRSVERIAWDQKEDRIAKLRVHLHRAEGLYKNEADRQAALDNVNNNRELAERQQEEHRLQAIALQASITARLPVEERVAAARADRVAVADK